MYGKPYGTCKYDHVYAKKMMFPIKIRIVIICAGNRTLLYGVFYRKHHHICMYRTAFHRDALCFTVVQVLPGTSNKLSQLHVTVWLLIKALSMEK